MNSSTNVKEEWVELYVDGLNEKSHYEISDQGNIRKRNKCGTYKPIKTYSSTSNTGRLRVSICGIIYLAHRLVADHFIPNPNGYFNIKFKDGDYKNIKADNLEWVSPSSNTEDDDLEVNSDEKWEVLRFNEKFKISNYGNIKKKRKDGSYRVVKGSRCVRTNILRVNISRTSYDLHMLIAEYFVPNPNNYNNVIFKDDDVTNLKYDNLEWSEHYYYVKPNTKKLKQQEQHVDEKWAEIKYLPRYEISTLGRARKKKADGEYEYFESRINERDGCLIISLHGAYYYTHRLLGEHFLPNPENHFYCLFKDGDKTNVCVDNLQWCRGNRLPKEQNSSI